MEKEYLVAVATEINKLISYSANISMSWGITNRKAMVYDNMPALSFKVNGFMHKGYVVIALNEVADLYEIYLISKELNVKKVYKEVYFDEVVNILDKEIEIGELSEEEYKSKVTDWMSNQKF